METSKVYVEDARGQPPNIPFWFGEAPGRSDELSRAVSRLRAGISQRLDDGQGAALNWLVSTSGVTPLAARLLLEYLSAARAALSILPTHEHIILERFFDETGDMHLVVHSPFGSRVNRAWGLALRKRFCRKFNFELQAAALEDSIVLSLGPTHSFPLEEVARYLKPETVEAVLVQALLTAPMFPAHWRYAATIALAVRRMRNGKKVPPQFQRNDAEDLMAVVFPDQLACAENLAGEREIPNHPLVHQAIDDCIRGLMDVDGLKRVLAGLKDGTIQVHARDLSAPSPLAQEIITARPFAFLDDAPAEERRTQAIRNRHLLDEEHAASLARPDPEAIAQVRREAWPEPRDADELHDGLVLAGFVALTPSGALEGPPDVDVNGWTDWFEELSAARRATMFTAPGGQRFWVSAERLLELQLIMGAGRCAPPIEPATGGPISGMDRDAALREIIRSRLEALGPVSCEELARVAGLDAGEVQGALLALETEGFVVRGRFELEPDQTSLPEQWCERRLLARIHRYTLKTLRRSVEPVSISDYMAFLFQWHRLDGEAPEGPDGLRLALARLEGFPIPAGAWESAVLPARVSGYLGGDLDLLTSSGEWVWFRPSSGGGQGGVGPVRSTPVVLVPRETASYWRAQEDSGQIQRSGKAGQVEAWLEQQGASFFADMVRGTGLLRTQVEQALQELVAAGRVTSDRFGGLRALVVPASKRASFSRRPSPRQLTVDRGGRWELLERALAPPGELDAEGAEYMAWVLLRRYGVVSRTTIRREARQLPPWRELVRVFRRLEARGEIRGGRFVDAVGGEQFALPEAVDQLRQVRRAPSSADILLSAADPLNLTGILLPGERIPAVGPHRILFRNGRPLAARSGGELTWLADHAPADEWLVRNRLS